MVPAARLSRSPWMTAAPVACLSCYGELTVSLLYPRLSSLKTRVHPVLPNKESTSRTTLDVLGSHGWAEAFSVHVLSTVLPICSSPLLLSTPAIHTDIPSKLSFWKCPHSLSSQGAQAESSSCVQTNWFLSLHSLSVH